MMALDALVSAVPSEMVATVGDKRSTKEEWDAIATMCIGDDRVKKATTQQLCSQFDQAMFGEGESVEDFALHLNGMVVIMATLGEVVEEHKVVEKILYCVPPRLKQMVLAILTLLDAESHTAMNLVGWLKGQRKHSRSPRQCYCKMACCTYWRKSGTRGGSSARLRIQA
jgi:hypothetical protein